jgi:hypothetical protein
MRESLYERLSLVVRATKSLIRLPRLQPLMSTAAETENGFFAFYREYAHTAVHTVTATALTAFGLLTFVHQAFVVLAIAVYVLPPIYLYLTRNGEPPEAVGNEITKETNGTDEPTDTAGGDLGGQSTEFGESTEPAATETAPSRDRNSPTNDTARNEEPTAEPSVTGSPSGATASNPETSEETTATETAARTTTERERAASAGSGSRTEADRTDTGRKGDEDRREDEHSNGSDESNGIDEDERDEPGERSEKPEKAGTETIGETGETERTEPVEPSEPIEEFEDTGEIRDTEGTGENGGTDETNAATEEWGEIDSPTSETLFDVVAIGEKAYIVGENGVVLAREAEWEVVLEHGPAAESTTLRGVDGTGDGKAVWIAGDSGVLGRYDTETGRHTDHSAPEGITDNWTDLAVAGAAGKERVSVVNGSGQVLVGNYDGSAVAWEEPVKPGSGSSMSAIEFINKSTGYCCDTNSGVYEISDEEFSRIGIEDGGSFTELAATDETIGVTDDDGTVQRFDGAIWTPLRAAENALSAIDTNEEEWIAVGAGGMISEQQGGGWEPVDVSTEANLHGIAIGATPVAVGDEGTLLERSES